MNQLSIQKMKERIEKELKKRKFIPLSYYAVEIIKKELAEILALNFHLPKELVQNLSLEIPPSHVPADLSLSMFEIAKEIKQNTQKITEEAVVSINKSKLNLIKSAKAAGPYLNFELKREKIYPLILSQIIKLKDRFGNSDTNARKTALIDYSGPNIAKPFGVGHLRSTVIGQALANIYEATGSSVIKDNHLGDWGTQFGKLIYAYQNWVDKEKFKNNPIEELNNLYVKFHREAKQEPEIEDKAREIFQKMEKGDKKLLKTWSKFKKISIKEFSGIYKKLGVSFDTHLGESCFVKASEQIINEALGKKIAFKDSKTGAIAVELKGLPSFLLRKQDNATLYVTRDLAALKFRTGMFQPKETLYVTGEEQALHFKQLFALARALGYAGGNKIKHISFGLVLTEDGKMSTRKGTLVRLEDLISQSIDEARKILIQKKRKLRAKEFNEVSEVIGVGAVIYNDLSQSRQKNIVFNWKKMLDFQGGSAAYLQYTYARINSIFKKARESASFRPAKIIFEKESEFALVKKLMFYPKIVINSRKFDSPHLIAVYLEEIAGLFNSFYNDASIIKTKDENLHHSRLLLIKSVSTVIKNGLKLLNIKVAERI